jgi:hypothetical protein
MEKENNGSVDSNDTVASPVLINAQVPSSDHDRNKDQKQWGINDTIGFWGLITNIIIACATVFIFWLTRESTNAAIDAAKTADLSYRLSIKALDEANKESRERFKMDSVNSQAQIDALKEQVKFMRGQFEIGNKPFLTVSDDINVHIENGKGVSAVECSVRNLGGYPTEITRLKSLFYYTPETDSIKWTIRNFKRKIAEERDRAYGFYISSSGTSITERPKDLKTSDFEKFQKGINSLIFGSEFIYQDLITRRTYRMQICIVINQPSKGQIAAKIVYQKII